MKTQHGGLMGGDLERGEEWARGRALAVPTSQGHTERQKTDLKLWHARIPIQNPTRQPVIMQVGKKENCVSEASGFHGVSLMHCPSCVGQEAVVLHPRSRKPRVLSSQLPGGGGRAQIWSGCLQLDQVSARPLAEAIPGYLGMKSECPCLQLCRH